MDRGGQIAVQIRALDPIHPGDWMVFADVLRRVAAFGVQDGHGIPHVMTEAMRQWTAPGRGERPGARCWAAMSGGFVVGHLVAEMAREADQWFANVAQYQVDRGFAWSEAQRRTVLDEVVAWAATFGVDQVRCTVRHPSLARAFAGLGFRDTGRRVLVLTGGDR